jgi:tetratricopeptide (TPR) repeat protein
LATRLLPTLKADRLITGDVALFGERATVTLRVYDRDGNLIGRVQESGRRGALVALGNALATAIGPLCDVTPAAPTEIGLGDVMPFVRAHRALLKNEVEDAGRALLAGKPNVANRLPSAREITDALLNQVTPLSSTTDLEITLLAGDVRVTVEHANELIAKKKDLDLAHAALARAHLAQLDLEAAKRDLAAAKSEAPPVLLARAALAEARGDTAARNRHIAPLLTGIPYTPALIWLAELPPKSLDTAEEALVEIAELKIDQPWIATRIGLRALAVEALFERGLSLISVEYLSDADLAILRPAVARAIEQKLNVGTRLQAAMLSRAGDGDGAIALLEKQPTLDVESRWLLGRLLHGADQAARAKTVLEPVKDLSPAHQRAYARILAETGDAAGARAMFLKLDDAASVDTWMARAAEAADKNQPTAAIAALEHALTFSPENRGVLTELAALYPKADMDTRGQETLAFLDKLDGKAAPTPKPTPAAKRVAVPRIKKPTGAGGIFGIVFVSLLGLIVTGGVVYFFKRRAAAAKAPAPVKRAPTARPRTEQPELESSPRVPVSRAAAGKQKSSDRKSLTLPPPEESKAMSVTSGLSDIEVNPRHVNAAQRSSSFGELASTPVPEGNPFAELDLGPAGADETVDVPIIEVTESEPVDDVDPLGFATLSVNQTLGGNKPEQKR